VRDVPAMRVRKQRGHSRLLEADPQPAYGELRGLVEEQADREGHRIIMAKGPGTGLARLRPWPSP